MHILNNSSSSHARHALIAFCVVRSCHDASLVVVLTFILVLATSGNIDGETIYKQNAEMITNQTTSSWLHSDPQLHSFSDGGPEDIGAASEPTATLSAST